MIGNELRDQQGAIWNCPAPLLYSKNFFGMENAIEGQLGTHEKLNAAILGSFFDKSPIQYDFLY